MAAKKSWRERLGFQDRSLDPEQWVEVATGYVDDEQTGFSAQAADIVGVLGRAGIEAHQRPYVRPDQIGFTFGAVTDEHAIANRIRVAVLVNARDSARAQKLLGELDSELAQAQISDEELTRQSLEAAEKLKRQAGSDG